MKSNHILLTLFCSIATVFTAVGMDQESAESKKLIDNLTTVLRDFIDNTNPEYFTELFPPTIFPEPQKPSTSPVPTLKQKKEKASQVPSSALKEKRTTSILPITQKKKRNKSAPTPKSKQVEPKETPAQRKKRKQREKEEEENRLLATAKAEADELRKKMGGGSPAPLTRRRSPAERRAYLQQLRLEKAEREREAKKVVTSYVWGTPQGSTSPIHAERLVHAGQVEVTIDLIRALVAKHQEVECPGIELTQDFLEEWTRLKNQHPHNPPHVLKELMTAKRPCCPREHLKELPSCICSKCLTSNH